jgi:hypothetical protein
LTAIILPTTTSPGGYSQESGGRLINIFAESLGETAGTRQVLRRVPGLSSFGTTVAQTGFRGMQSIGATLYSAWSGKVVTHSVAGGTETVLAGTLAGTTPVFFARNNATTPDLVCVAPGDGAYKITSSTVSNYPDADVLQPNSVCYSKGFFIFTYGDGTMRSSDVNSTNINALNYAAAESRPDTLYRAIPMPNGQLIACGSESLEVWGGINDTGFPFSYISTIPLGIAGPYCVTGYEDGWGGGLAFVGSDYSVYQLTGYTPSKISTPDLDRLIEAVSDKTTIQASVFVKDGHSFIVIQSPGVWTWVYDTNTQRWHNRASYLLPAWRGRGGHKAFGKWLVGDTVTQGILSVDDTVQTEFGKPLVGILETGPMGNFPYGGIARRLDLFMSVGVGQATGLDPIQTDPAVEIKISHDNGVTWSMPWKRHLGRQTIGDTKITVNVLGHVGPQGAKLRVEVSDPVHLAILGGDLDLKPKGK